MRRSGGWPPLASQDVGVRAKKPTLAGRSGGWCHLRRWDVGVVARVKIPRVLAIAPAIELSAREVTRGQLV